MHIAMIGQKGIPTRFGGIERHVEALAVRLGAAGHRVTVFSRGWYAPARAEFSKGVRVVVTPTIATKHLDAIVHTFTSTVRAIRDGVDIIHYHGVGPSLLAWIPRIFAPRIRVVATFHCIDRHHQKWNVFARFALGLGERAACSFAHETIAVSRTLQSYCDNSFSVHTRYIPNGISEPTDAGDDLLAGFGLAKGQYIAMVSRLVKHKGVHYLIDAFKELKAMGATGGKKLAIVGDTAFTDEYVAECKALAGNDPDIVFTGYQNGDRLHQIFANAYAVVHPSESEGLPIAVLEAMSYGKAVLASDIPEIMEVTRIHGLAFRSGSVKDLVRKLRHLLANPELAVQKGAEAKEFVLRDYQWDDIVAETETLYLQLLNQEPSAATAGA
jgi:glycosyltransferase involved in cell wall biosynthesis